MASVKGQWLKRTILQRNLPNKQKEDVKSLLTLTQTEAGTDIYLKLKRNLVRIYAPKAQDAYRRALARTMVGLPSQLGYQIVDDICRKSSKLTGCCCEGAAQAIWEMKLPVNIRAHISKMEFTHATYREVFEAADQVFLSSRQVSVAAVAVNNDSGALNETLPAFAAQNQPQVAAVGRGRGQRGGRRGRGQRGSRGSRGAGQSGAQAAQTAPRGPRHSSMPPEQCCDRHYRHGDQAWYCLAPLTCPWVTKVTAK